jgi:hypothetical protein
MNSLFRRLYYEQEGQVLYLVAALLIGLLGMAALSIDIGFALHGQRELQASADAAATAGGLDLSNNDTATGAEKMATLYSGVTGQNNAINDLYNVKATATAECLTYLTNLGLACENKAAANAMAVQETASAPTFFAKLFGISSIKLTASSLSSMKSGTPAPANIVVVVDTTASMASGDTTGNCTISGISSPTKEDCAKAGVRTFLGELAPCASGLSPCPTATGSASSGYNVPSPVDQVALLVFPGLTSTSLDPDDYACQKTQLTTSNGIAPYAPAGTSPPYYTIVPGSSDYRTSDTSGLNGATSDLVKAVDWADGNNCLSSAYGLEDNGGVGTYYAGVITAAQSDLSALTGTRASMQSAIIVLGDGDSNATWCNPCTHGQTSEFTSTTPQSYSVNECAQAVTAAGNAAATANAVGLKTWVYSIAYGALTSGSCSTDNPPTGSSAYNTGCKTMTAIASDADKFYSDDAKGCVSTAHSSITSLTKIFQNVADDFKTTRLLPWGTQ